ncbi:MAG TPA: hypothetical protein VHZ50_02765 [Puia sp.]|jgi:hypothetical protein|nr:hypothetical protein [Puia sp.]
MSKVTWNDLNNATQSELKKTYKLSDRQMEQSVRHHLDGANAQERRQVYQKFYSRKSL